MAFRGNNNRNRNFGGNYGGGPMAGGNNRMGMNMSPWDNQNAGGGNYGGGNMRQGGGGGGVGGGQGMNAQAISLANNLLNNLFRNQNPPSLLDLPRGGGGMAGNRNQRPGPMVNRAGPGNRNNQRRVQGGFNNRGGAKVAPNKQGGGIRKQNAFDRAKKLLAKNSNKKKDSAPGENTENSKKNESSQVKESPYANVPNDMFYCHLCKKHMWDANSFENHIKGRAHLMMREGIEESYRLRANMIRQEAKIAEQLKSVELDRLKRMGKSKNRNLEYCTMCDLNFHGHLSAHRKSDGHLQLKKFLHPKCNECNKEFSTRIDYDSHLLSADHLKKAAEKNTKVGERKKNTLTILTEEDELKDVRPPQKKKKKVAAPAAGEVKKEGEEGAEKKEDEEGEEKKEGEEEAADEAKEGDELNETKEEEEEEVALPEDGEDIIVDFNDGDDVPVEIDAKLPKYNWTRPVGASMITKLECFECSICGKFFDNEKTVEVHSRTVSHHRQFVKFLNDKSSDTKIAQKRAAAAIEETERKKRKIEEATAAAAASEAKKEAGEEEGDADVKEENGEEANDELYDPSEATGDDEDVDMAENGDKEVADEEMADEENGDAAEEEEMETQNEEVKEEATPVKAEPAKAPAAPAAATPAPAAASPAAAATPTTPTQATSPQKKGAAAAAAKTPAAKATPRGRGRGRYNRY